MEFNPELIDVNDLKVAISNFKTTKVHEDDFNSAVIRIGKLRAYLDEIEKLDKDIDGIRIYLVRKFPKPVQDWPFEDFLPIELNGKQTTQMTLAIVPVTNFEDSKKDKSQKPNSPKDFSKNGKIFVLLPGEINTGLCPPRCDEDD